MSDNCSHYTMHHMLASKYKVCAQKLFIEFPVSL